MTENKNVMKTLLKSNYLWILLFGSLIGLNETLTGSLNIPYRSVVLSTITIALLAMARYYIPKTGTSLVIIAVALLFKMNTMGVHNCTAPAMLCGPTAMLLLGIGFEIFASLLVGNRPFRHLNYLLTCALTAAFAFTIFAILQTYILSIWDSARLVNYIFIRGMMTAMASGIVSISLLLIVRRFGNINISKINPSIVHGVLFSIILTLWFLGYYSA